MSNIGSTPTPLPPLNTTAVFVAEMSDDCDALELGSSLLSTHQDGYDTRDSSLTQYIITRHGVSY